MYTDAGFDNTNGILYVVGGQDDDDAPLNTMEAYDVEANTWTTREPMPTARYQHGAEFDNTNGILYVVGGNSGSDILNTVEAYHA